MDLNYELCKIFIRDFVVENFFNSVVWNIVVYKCLENYIFVMICILWSFLIMFLIYFMISGLVLGMIFIYMYKMMIVLVIFIGMEMLIGII